MSTQRSAGQHGHGVTLFSAALDTAVPAGAPASPPWTEWSEVRSINGLPFQASVTNLTHLSSPGKAMEKIAGFINAGQVTVRLNTTAASLLAIYSRMPAAAPGRAASNIHWIIYFPDWGLLYFEGFVQQAPTDVPEDGEITVELTIEASGLPTFVTF